MQKEKTFHTNEVSSNIKKYVRVKQAAEFLGVSAAHIYRLAERRLIPHYKSGGGKVIYFALSDLENYVTHTYVAPIAEVQKQIDQQSIMKNNLKLYTRNNK